MRPVNKDIQPGLAIEILRTEHQHKRGTHDAWDAIASLEAYINRLEAKEKERTALDCLCSWTCDKHKGPKPDPIRGWVIT